MVLASSSFFFFFFFFCFLLDSFDFFFLFSFIFLLGYTYITKLQLRTKRKKSRSECTILRHTLHSSLVSSFHNFFFFSLPFSLSLSLYISLPFSGFLPPLYFKINIYLIESKKKSSVQVGCVFVCFLDRSAEIRFFGMRLSPCSTVNGLFVCLFVVYLID